MFDNDLMIDSHTLFITWTTYGSWLPGDVRGWRKTRAGTQKPQPLLANWCRERMKEEAVLLNEKQRRAVEQVFIRHAEIRGWELHTVNVRSNHIHVVVTADRPPNQVRDQFKANATRVLRELDEPVKNEKIWTRGGDVQLIDGESELESVIRYVSEAQDRMDRGR